MALVESNLLELRKVTELVSKLPFMQSFFSHCGDDGVLYKATLDQLATFLAPYITAVGGSGFVATTGTVLPAASAGKFTIVGAGTYTQTTGGNVVTTELLNVLGSSSTTWAISAAIGTSALVSKDFSDFGGRFATLAEANVAIPNTVVNGKNQRSGKRVYIGTATDYVAYWWKGGTADGNLVLVNETSSPLNFLTWGNLNGFLPNISPTTLQLDANGKLTDISSTQVFYIPIPEQLDLTKNLSFGVKYKITGAVALEYGDFTATSGGAKLGTAVYSQRLVSTDENGYMYVEFYTQNQAIPAGAKFFRIQLRPTNGGIFTLGGLYAGYDKFNQNALNIVSLQKPRYATSEIKPVWGTISDATKISIDANNNLVAVLNSAAESGYAGFSVPREYVDKYFLFDVVAMAGNTAESVSVQINGYDLVSGVFNLVSADVATITVGKRGLLKIAGSASPGINFYRVIVKEAKGATVRVSVNNLITTRIPLSINDEISTSPYPTAATVPVNNLTSTDPTAFLAAPMGKELKDQLDATGTPINQFEWGDLTGYLPFMSLNPLPLDVNGKLTDLNTTQIIYVPIPEHLDTTKPITFGIRYKLTGSVFTELMDFTAGVGSPKLGTVNYTLKDILTDAEGYKYTEFYANGVTIPAGAKNFRIQLRTTSGSYTIDKFYVGYDRLKVPFYNISSFQKARYITSDFKPLWNNISDATKIAINTDNSLNVTLPAANTGNTIYVGFGPR